MYEIPSSHDPLDLFNERMDNETSLSSSKTSLTNNKQCIDTIMCLDMNYPQELVFD